MPNGRSLVVPGPLGIILRRKGLGRKFPVFRSLISAARFCSRFASNILTLTLSIPAAPRFRFTARNAWSINRGVILPVSECTFLFLGTVCLSRVAITEFGRVAPLEHVSQPIVGFPGKSAGRPFGASADGLTVRMWSSSFSVIVRFLLSQLGGRRSATPDLLLSSTRRRLRRPAPLRRVSGAVSPAAYRHELPTVGRRRTSPVCLRTIFFRRRHASPAWFTVLSRIANDEKTVRFGPRCFAPRCFTKRVRWLAHQTGRNAVSQSHPAWLLRRRSFSGPPG